MSDERPDLDDAERRVLERIEEENVDAVQLQFTDILGTVKTVTIPSHQAEKAFRNGIWFDGSSIEGFVRIHESDMRLDPDPDTFTLLPWRENGDSAVARIIADVTDNTGEPFDGDPRNVLKTTIERAEELGFQLNVGPEPEFFVFRTDEDGNPTEEPHDDGGYFDLAPRDMAHDLRRDIIDTLEEMGFEVEASHHEVAKGQHEIDFRYSDALETADNIATLRWVVRTIAQRHGVHATFMPKPVQGINGSGMHTHLSLFRGGENAFHDPEDEFGLSDTAYHFLGGLIEHAPALSAVCSPTVNSYKRLIPGYEAPVYIAWSDVNRSALIRKPAARSPSSTRLELRSPDPSANPYLALAAILGAGLDGVENEIAPPAPVRENIYELTAEKRRQQGIGTLPGNLKEAIDALEQDQVVQNALGSFVTEKFVEAKRSEWDDYRAQVTPWEKESYLSTF